jgi:PAS domain S-box-containing protein
LARIASLLDCEWLLSLNIIMFLPVMFYRSTRAEELLDPLPVPAYLWDCKTEKFVDSNQAFCDLLGYSADEIHDLDWRQMIAQDEIATAERAIKAGPKMQRVSWHFRRKDGVIIPVTLASRAMTFIDDDDHFREVYMAIVLSTGEDTVSSATAFPAREELSQSPELRGVQTLRHE